MTNISTFEDILRAMEQNPTLREAMRRHILTEELIQLPARVSRLEELVADIAAKLVELASMLTQFMEQTNLALARLNERQDRLEQGQARLETDVTSLQEGQARLETDVTSLKQGQARLETDVTSLKQGQARLETDVTSLKQGQARLETDVTSLQQGQARLETDVTSLKEGQAKLEEGQARLEQGQNRLAGQLSNLIGSDYERKAARLTPRRLRQQLGISQADILRAITVPEKLDLTRILNQATEADAISHLEADDLELADLVFRGHDPGENLVHVVAEVSLTIQDEDIRRAARRAFILERAAGAPTLPAVIGESISDANIELANQQRVTFIQIDSQPT